MQRWKPRQKLASWVLVVTIQCSYNGMVYVYHFATSAVNSTISRSLAQMVVLVEAVQTPFIIIIRYMTLSVGWNYTAILASSAMLADISLCHPRMLTLSKIAVAKHLGLQILRLTGNIILPFNTTHYTYEIEKYLDR